jgi:alpha-glucosidase
MTARVIVMVMVVSCATCGHGVPTGGSRFTLSNGAVVNLPAEGGVELEMGGPRVFALAPASFPTVRTFRESTRSVVAIWEFRRSEETAWPLDRRLGAAREDESVAVSYRSADGAIQGEVAIEPAGNDITRLRFGARHEASSLALPIRCDEGGSFHGFGEQYNATDQRGESFSVFVSEQGIRRDGSSYVYTGDEHTTYFPMPYYLDARGFGVLVLTDSRTVVDLCASDPSVAWLEVVSGEPLELLIFHGPTPLDVIRQLGGTVGRPALPPSWAFDGVWVGAQGGRDEVLTTAAALEAAGIEASALWVQDWTGHRQNIDGGYGVQYRWAADPELYPDLPGMIAELHEGGLRFLSYVNPFVDPNLPDHYPEMAEQGLLIGDPREDGPYLFAAPNGGSSHPDLTNPAAREHVKDALRVLVEEYGMDGWMADFAEYQPLDAVLFDGRDPVGFHNDFPTEWERLTREVMDDARPDGDWVMFARSGFTGVQEVAQIHWAGDQEATWSETDGLPTVVPALINLGLSGQPFVTHDIGGFSGGPRTKELFMRWTELGAFTPFMRTHEGNRRSENWQWDSDDETTAHFRRFVRVHRGLAPEFQALAREAQRTSAPLLRHLLLVFPDDPETWGIGDQFMIGQDLLVAPVLREGATSRSVYLPAGTWYDVWTGETIEGGRSLEVTAPIGAPPVFSLGRDRPDLRAVE